MGKLSLDNVIRVTLLLELLGIANQNTSALAIITSESPLASSYGTYGIYYDPVSVAADFGSASRTAGMATAIFSQTPNVISGGGYLVIIPRNQSNPATAGTVLSSSTVDLTQLTATDYTLGVSIDGAAQENILIGSIDSSSLASAQTSLNNASLTGAKFTLTGTVTAARVTLTSNTTGATSEIKIDTAASGTDLGSALLLSGDEKGSAAGLEAIRDAILRTYGSIYYFGIVCDIYDSTNLLNIAGLVQSIDKMFFVASSVSSDISGVFTQVTNAGYKNTRCLYYSVSAASAINIAAAYASDGLSVDFTASNSVRTMHLKSLVGFVADDGLTQTLATQAQNAGVDVYADFGASNGFLFTSGANGYFDAVYTGLAFKFALQTAGFNALASAGNRIAQTEDGMNQLKKAYRGICDQFVFNGAFAPGTWNGTTFGSPADFLRNIEDFGYYIYSQPVAQQSQTQRGQRIAPAVQIAAKSSGAIHSSDVLALIEA